MRACHQSVAAGRQSSWMTLIGQLMTLDEKLMTSSGGLILDGHFLILDEYI